ncbi:hypothetical protein NK8_17240 [Caballeronia sp. NK8]|uniref:hypothetical protein n=1 Tax=Caballeronia sp. NK8 TaxID=140098 RepID=UPI001BB535A6|nr:hypothetical protein [Caballeronia sp. NK8]BCQ23588.1 hypothetical protein NK8_17240 [Caballeronia sp. NK8]
MRGHIYHTTTIRRRMRFAITLALTLCASHVTIAKPGGEPLVLDTQTGIHSGVSGGTVLQSGPLGGPGMVPMATLPGLPQQPDQPIVVSPYVEYSSGQSSVPVQPGHGVRPRNPRAPYP